MLGEGGLGSADAAHAEFPVQQLELAKEALVGVDVAAGAHEGEGFSERHPALDHQEGQRARGGAGYPHKAMN